MSSPPPTPSALAPASQYQSRFESLSAPTEWIEDYRPGKLHPVHLGDLFQESKYRVIRKLGYGSFSTVWLGKDQLCGRYVAIKLLTADASSTGVELDILRHLSQSSLEHPGREHVMTLLDEFKHQGPNGVHTCLVFDVMGPSAASMVELLPDNQPMKYGMRARYPGWMAKSMLRQALLGLDYLHQNEIVHGDFQPGNILFSVDNLDSVDEDRLSQNLSPDAISRPVQRLDGKKDLWAPTYLALNQPLTEFVKIDPDFRVKISDLGGAFFVSKPPEKHVTPSGLRAPELILGGQVSSSQDIWSFGCLLFQFFTGVPLFIVYSLDDDVDKMNDLHLLLLSDILGPLPDSLLSRWSRAHIYFDDKGQNIKSYVGDLPEGFDVNKLPLHHPSLENYFDKHRGAELGPDEAKKAKALLRLILQYDEKLRPSAADLLQHPWFTII